MKKNTPAPSSSNNKKKTTPPPAHAENLRFPIVGIGASAGGLEALEQFLRHVPQSSGLAFVVIQHLDPTHKAMLSELLQRVTVMKVTQAKDRMQVKPNCIYIIPPNKDMSILHGVLHLFTPTAPRGLRLPAFNPRADLPCRSLPPRTSSSIHPSPNWISLSAATF
ncbi:MAG: chemotaxis protein CheB [Desulfuromonadaceae bacterium]|nr:chemotaxis protein CheB [Desulfuromonas sp.]MDY0185737.1 chemotaxis protein CheB [Desulfuromonadaceae bacterium]